MNLHDHFTFNIFFLKFSININHCFFHNILSHVSCYESHSGWHNEPGMTLGISLKNVFDLQPWQKMLPLRTLSALA